MNTHHADTHVSDPHVPDEVLTLHFYGEGRHRDEVARHLQTCAACAATYREIADTLSMIAAPEVPDRGDQYGLEVWQGIRHRLPERDTSWRTAWTAWFRADRLVLAGATALVLGAFATGRLWPRPADVAPAADPAPLAISHGAAAGTSSDVRHRILVTAIADHLDRSERVLTDIMNAPSRRDISNEQRWADDLLTTSRLYRQDAVEAGELSIADVLDELERSLLEIVHSLPPIDAVDLEQIRRRIDAAALLFKVRVMSDQLRGRDDATPQTSTRIIG